LADLALPRVRSFLEEWLRFLHSEHEQIIKALVEKREITDEIRSLLEKAVVEFKERFGG